MKTVICWTLLLLALVASVTAISVIAFTSIHTPLDPDALLRITNFVERTAGITFVASFLTGMIFSLAPGLRERYREWDNSYKPQTTPWPIQLCQVLMTSAFLVLIFSLPENVFKDSTGRWLTGWGKGDGPNPVSEAQAVAYLWKDLRAYTAIILGLSAGWLIVALSLILNKPSRISRYFNYHLRGVS